VLSDADSDPLTWSASGLPSGLSIDPDTGAISGTLGATAHEDSPYLVTVTLSDGTHDRSAQFLWTVTEVGLENPSTQESTEGDSVSLSLRAPTSLAEGVLTYRAVGLPDGLTLDTDTGSISGTLAAGSAAAGPFTVTVAASDGTLSTSQTFTWTVA